MSKPPKVQSVGIDFGTSNSTVAVWEEGKARALEIDTKNENPRVLRSLIYVNPKGEMAFGKEAIERYSWDLINIPSQRSKLKFTGRYIKTFAPSSQSGVGKMILVPEIIEVDESGRGRLLSSLKSVLTSESFLGTELFGKFYSLEELLGLILAEMRRRAEAVLEKEVKGVVLGRPVKYVGETNREKLALNRMRQVAIKAGFEEIEFEYEPVGAALNYGIQVNKQSRILVFDFGGGTLDVCVMEFPGKSVLGVSGRPIGGDLINGRLMEGRLLRHFGSEVVISGKTHVPRVFMEALSKNWYQIGLLKNVKNMEALEYFLMNSSKRQPIENLIKLIENDLGYKLFEEIDRVKVALSDKDGAVFDFGEGGIAIEEEVSRDDLERYIETDVEESRECVMEAMRAAEIVPPKIDKVVITGGSSKIPKFKGMLKEVFGQEKLIDSDPFLSVAQGLAIRASGV
jgi:hypothetical chaperone protein